MEFFIGLHFFINFTLTNSFARVTMKEDIQTTLFQLIKNKIAGQDSLGTALSDVLSISPDAVYRRYRGETHLTVQEVKRLVQSFQHFF